MKTSTLLLILILALTGCQKTPSNIKLPSLIGDNMLLQQKTDTKIWGKATPDMKISVTAEWNVNAVTNADKDGRWTVILPTPEAGGPYKVTISARDTIITINNVLIGDVWFCSGQSNMEMPVAGWPPDNIVMNSATAIDSASIPEIHLFMVQRKVSGEPLDECVGKWEVCSPESVRQFSATGFFFGRKLHKELHMPIGLIESSWGGTPSEAWTSAGALEKTGEFSEELASIKESAPDLEDYQTWLNGHKQVEVAASGDDQWKNLDFGDENISAPVFDDKSWPAMSLPDQFEKAMGEFDGAVWFRKTIEVPKAMEGFDLVLSLGPIDDMDRTYFNGELVGATELSGLWQAERNYNVPGTLVKSGQNTVAVRVLDTQGGGGIYGTTGKLKLSLKSNSSVAVSLEGEWKYQPVAEFIGNKFFIYDISKNEFASRKRPALIGPGSPSSLYNAMVNPVLSYKIKGAIWYQGEANVGRPEQYAKIFPAMIEDWREAWGIKDFPFYFVQIAPYIYSGVDSTELAYLREAQEKALVLPNTGIALTLDLGVVNNIHPPFKVEVGERLAALALTNNYGMKFPVAGPSFKSMTVEGNSIKIQFANTAAGLVSKNPELTEFEIAGKDGKYMMAKARLIGNEVVVSSKLVKEPVNVRYCWRNGSVASLFNAEGLPANQFRTK